MLRLRSKLDFSAILQVVLQISQLFSQRIHVTPPELFGTRQLCDDYKHFTP